MNAVLEWMVLMDGLDGWWMATHPVPTRLRRQQRACRWLFWAGIL